MTLTHAFRYASIFAVAALLATSLGTHQLRAQGAATSSSDADAKKKADAAKAAKATAEKPKSAAEKPAPSTPTGY
jgi:hypothetical protein